MSNSDDIQGIIKDTVELVLANEDYHPTKVAAWISNINDQCLKRLVTLEKGYKYIVTAIIMQKRNTGLHLKSSCYWDITRDGE